MGVGVEHTDSETATPEGTFIPAKGRPGAHVQPPDDMRLFSDELADKGFLVTSTAQRSTGRAPAACTG